jgi:hypothetical protein
MKKAKETHFFGGYIDKSLAAWGTKRAESLGLSDTRYVASLIEKDKANGKRRKK